VSYSFLILGKSTSQTSSQERQITLRKLVPTTPELLHNKHWRRAERNKL
jgi:hypothetical protein